MKITAEYSRGILLAEASSAEEPCVFVCPRMGTNKPGDVGTTPPRSTTGCAQKVNKVLMGLSAPFRITRLKEVYIRETAVVFVIVWLDVPGLYELGSGEVTVADYEPIVHDRREQCTEVPLETLHVLKQLKPP